MGPERLTTWMVAFVWDTGSPSTDPLLEWLSRGGALGVLAFVVIGFVRGWIVPSPEVQRLIWEIAQLRTERDRALDLVYTQAEVAGKALAALSESQEKLHSER